MNPLKNLNKFEQDLKAQFDNFEAKPNEGLWENIAQNIPADNFEKNISSKLNTLQFEPKDSVWIAIEKRLPLIKQFNKKIIYLWTFTVLAIGIFLGYLLNNFYLIGYQKTELTHPKAFIWLKDGNLELSSLQNKRIEVDYNFKKSSKKDRNKIEFKEFELQNNNFNSKKLMKNYLSEKSPKNSFKKINQTEKILNDKTKISNSISSGLELNTNNYEDKTIKNDIVQKEVYESKTIVVNEKNETTPIELKKPKADSIEAPNSTSFNQNNLAIEDNYTGASLKKEKFTIIAYSGIGFSYMNYSSDVNKWNMALREKSEVTESNITGGFIFGYDISKRITLSSGFILSNFKQTLNYNKEKAVSPSGNYEENLMFYNDTISIGNSNSSSLNYSFTEIPIFVTYKIFESKKFELALQSGIGLGILTGVNTFIISEDNIGIYAVSSKNDFPNFKNTLFFSFQPQFTYNLCTPGVSLGLMPIFKSSILSIVDNENWIKQYPYNLSMNLFLRKRF